MKKMQIVISLAIASIVLSGCGGGGGGGTTPTTDTPPVTSTEKTAYLIDSAVEGIDYTCGTLTGTTDSTGKFTYDSTKCPTGVEFRLGSLSLGTINPSTINTDSYLTIQELAGTTRDNITDGNVTKLAVLLQSLDDDSNPDNGILITQTIKNGFTLTGNIKDIDSVAIGNEISNRGKIKKNILTVQEHLQQSMNSINVKIDTNKLTKKHEITLDYMYAAQLGNIVLDNSTLILAGGNNCSSLASNHDGSSCFSNKVITINADTGIQKDFTFTASSGHAFGELVGNGIGNTAKIHKLGDSKYLISGGFQYVKTMEFLDINTNTIETFKSDVNITDDTGLNTTPFFANGQGSSVLNNNKVGFFGFNNGLYGMDTIMLFDNTTKTFNTSNVKLSMNRYNIGAYSLKDGRVLLVGGWDNSASTLPDSATRRVEIYDPESDTITRKANYPQPLSQTNRVIFPERATENAICVDNFKYVISTDSWSSGCDLSYAGGYDSNIPGSYMNLPDNSSVSGVFLGITPNGSFVYYVDGEYSSVFSDDYNGYPVNKKAKIVIYSTK